MSIPEMSPYRGRTTGQVVAAKLEDTNPIHAAYRAYLAADEHWHNELVLAFGKNACNRRYDFDQSSHPQSCREAYERYKATGDAWRSLVLNV